MQREVDCVDLSEQETLQEFCNFYQCGNKTVCQGIKIISVSGASMLFDHEVKYAT